MILGGSVWELGRTGRDARVLGGTGRCWGGVKGRQCEALQGTKSTGEGTETSKKELGMEIRTTGRN